MLYFPSFYVKNLSIAFLICSVETTSKPVFQSSLKKLRLFKAREHWIDIMIAVK